MLEALGAFLRRSHVDVGDFRFLEGPAEEAWTTVEALEMALSRVLLCAMTRPATVEAPATA